MIAQSTAVPQHFTFSMASKRPEPEVYWTTPTAFCPNSKLPVLVYRNVLPRELTVDSATKMIEANQWLKGGMFTHYPKHHFHSNTHEIYAAVKGSTSCVYGVGPLDDEEQGIKFDMNAGDVAVHGAGIAHRNARSSDDYTYIGFYPEVSLPR